MYLANLDEVILAIENHTVLMLAGMASSERQEILQRRAGEIGGMLELARRLSVQTKLIRFLERHRHVLLREIEGG